MDHSIITLTTDFGVSSPYVAQMKGVILAHCPGVTLVDITNAIRPQDIRQAAFVVSEATPLFPRGTIHVVVVDPGVGTARGIVFAQIGEQSYVAPDNGVLSHLAARVPPSRIFTLADERFWLPDVSSTFHGRDIMAPVAARVRAGLSPTELGPPQTSLVQLDWPEVTVLAGRIEGEVIAMDSFGNLITSITREQLAGVPVDDTVGIFCDDHETRGIFTAYGDQPDMTLIALLGSSGHLELAIVGDSAATMLGVHEGAKVKVRW